MFSISWKGLEAGQVCFIILVCKLHYVWLLLKRIEFGSLLLDAESTYLGINKIGLSKN